MRSRYSAKPSATRFAEKLDQQLKGYLTVKWANIFWTGMEADAFGLQLPEQATNKNGLARVENK